MSPCWTFVSRSGINCISSTWSFISNYMLEIFLFNERRAKPNKKAFTGHDTFIGRYKILIEFSSRFAQNFDKFLIFCTRQALGISTFYLNGSLWVLWSKYTEWGNILYSFYSMSRIAILLMRPTPCRSKQCCEVL